MSSVDMYPDAFVEFAILSEENRILKNQLRLEQRTIELMRFAYEEQNKRLRFTEEILSEVVQEIIRLAIEVKHDTD